MLECLIITNMQHVSTWMKTGQKNYHYRGTYDKNECITVLYIIGTSSQFNFVTKICGNSIFQSRGTEFEYPLEFLLYNYMKNINHLSQQI